jgi:predicted metal-dependent phosphoesterase TrpH
MARERDEAVERVISTLQAETRQDLVILAIPSHDRKGKKLNNQDQWAEAALDLFAELYGGATALNTFAGIYKDAGGKIHKDKPIMVESYAARADLEDMDKARQLCDFIRRMGRETRQAAVALVINNVFCDVVDFGDDEDAGDE